MSPRAAAHGLGEFAKAGFQQLSEGRAALNALAAVTAVPLPVLLKAFAAAADPDAALRGVEQLLHQQPQLRAGIDETGWRHLVLLIGASPAFGQFFARRPERLPEIIAEAGALIGAEEASRELLAAVGCSAGETGAVALRVRYRELLARVMLYDLRSTDTEGGPLEHLEAVATSLSHLADAALEAALVVARATLLHGEHGSPIAEQRLQHTRLAVIAMGKCGAQELNVVSDVDVMFIAEPAAAVPNTAGQASADETYLTADAAVATATRIATELMRVIHDPGVEPPLWQIDPNLRPEGRKGALVRSLGSMLGYYERWAKSWEFQALVKARAAAGDLTLGAQFVAATRAMVWESSGREDFVGSVRRMRERVTEQLDTHDLEVQLKLGPGGLRDIEFSVQLLQLVHGQHDQQLRLAATLPALAALVAGGYVARTDGVQLAHDYRVLRLLEHRLQLRELRRTEMMPRDAEGLRVLARATALTTTGDDLLRLWKNVSREVRELHLKIFYAPLLSAVASLPDAELVLGGDQARARLHSIGFQDPDGAMRHLVALTTGSSRRARIQRNLLPVLLRLLSEGRDPDYGLLAFRRVSEANLDAPWYLRLLRDGAEAAERLTWVLANSRFAAELLESIPGAVAWLERDELLRPVPLTVLLEEMRSLASRRDTPEEAAAALRAVHRREILRLALGRLVRVIDDAEVAQGLDAAHTALLDGLLVALRESRSVTSAEALAAPHCEFALIGMGRYGGGELGFASDLDLLAVFRAIDERHAEQARTYAERLLAELRRLIADPRFAVELDFGLRPEGKHGPIVRSLDAYRAYYQRWSLTWEAQALLRARPVAGDTRLGEAFERLADEFRYPHSFGEDEVREVRRIKARVEAERLPRGADPKRHLKLGPGGISDVEWLVQLLQLQHGATEPTLRTTSTLAALETARAAGLISETDYAQLIAAWQLASGIRSAARLWSGRVSDVLPVDRTDLNGIAGILGMPEGRTTELEERWFGASRRARQVFEREFFGYLEPQRNW